MTNSFSHLEILIGAALQQQSLPVADRNIDDIVFQINHEKERIMTTIYDEENIEMYVQTRQYQLVQLIDQMLFASPPVAMDSTFKNIYSSLNELLQFLEKNFAAYMDENCKVPYNYLLKAQYHFSAQVKDLELKWDCYDEQNDAFKELLTAPFYQLLAVPNPYRFYSYYKLAYLRKLMNKLLQAPAEEWQELLLSYDFNDPDYVRYLTDMIQSEIRDMQGLSPKREVLLQWQRIVVQTLVFPRWHYMKLHKPLRQQLFSWIAQELTYLDKIEVNDTQFGELVLWKGYKVNTGFTVPQLGRFIGLLLEEEIILNANKKELALFFSVFFSTIEKDHISPGHLRNSFYNKIGDLAKAMHVFFEKLLNRIKKDI